MGCALSSIIKNQLSRRTGNNDTNGFYLNTIYIPEHVLLVILSHVEPKCLLKCKLVCKLWNDLIKSLWIWHQLCERNHMTPKNLPWYIYYMKFATDFFDTDIMKDDYSPDKYEELKGDTFFNLVRNRPTINLKNTKIRKHIIDNFQPTIVASDWFCFVPVCCRGPGHVVQRRQETFVIENYGDDLDCLINIVGEDKLVWRGRHGIKRDGSSLKILFESISNDESKLMGKRSCKENKRQQI